VLVLGCFDEVVMALGAGSKTRLVRGAPLRRNVDLWLGASEIYSFHFVRAARRMSVGEHGINVIQDFIFQPQYWARVTRPTTSQSLALGAGD